MDEPTRWRQAIEEAYASGYTYFDLLTAHDDLGRSDALVVTLRVRHRDHHDPMMIAVQVPRQAPQLPRIDDLFAGASWGQRYVHDFYGVIFDGAELDPLLNHEGGTPLRKDVPLVARQQRVHPAGEQQQGSRRRRR